METILEWHSKQDYYSVEIPTKRKKVEQNLKFFFSSLTFVLMLLMMTIEVGPSCLFFKLCDSFVNQITGKKGLKKVNVFFSSWILFFLVWFNLISGLSMIVILTNFGLWVWAKVGSLSHL